MQASLRCVPMCALVLLVACAAAPKVLDRYGWNAPGRGITRPGPAMLAAGQLVVDRCESVENPWRGPALCGYDAVLRPGHKRCSTFTDASPNLDPLGGWYRGERDAKNWVTAAPGAGSLLQLLAAYVVDNGEGEDFPHGPHGNLYWDVFARDEPLWRSPDGRAQRRLSRPRVLRGPHRTHGRTDEWLDDEALVYSNAGLFVWGSQPRTADVLTLRIYESDGSEDGFLGRRNDVLGMERIRRRDVTGPCGVWVPFHRYNNGHPRRRTDQVAVWLQLRTWQEPPGPLRYHHPIATRPVAW